MGYCKIHVKAANWWIFFYLNPGEPRTLLQLKLVGILMITFF
jgi:hypothetical protein